MSCLTSILCLDNRTTRYRDKNSAFSAEQHLYIRNSVNLILSPNYFQILSVNDPSRHLPAQSGIILISLLLTLSIFHTLL